MELKPGYKQTEVGVIPEDWDTRSVLQVCSQIMDYRGRTPKKLGLDWGGGEIPALSAGNVKQGYIDFTAECYLGSERLYRRWMTHGDVEKDDILFTTEAPLGNVALVPDSRKYILSQRTILLQVAPSKATSRFLFQLMRSASFQRVLADYSSGSTAKGIQRKKFEELPVALPPTLAEQEAIAGALSDADALIDSLEQLIAKKRRVKQGAMQDLLTGKKRLPGFEGEWEVKTFGEIFNFLPTATNSRSDLQPDGDTFYIHYGDIHTRFHSHLDFSKTSPPRIDRRKCRNAALLQNGDWVMADASEDYDGVGKTIEILGLEPSTPAISGLHTFVLREKTPTFAPGFKGHLGNLKSLHDQYLRVATGMKVFGVSKTALRDLELPIPGMAEQTAIAAILSDMDAEIAALEAKLAKARQVKQGMMQELLTGKTRLV